MPRRAHRRTPAALAALALVPGLLVLQGVGTGAAGVGTAAADGDLRTGETYRARIVRTEHGIPHITARTWGSLGFGNGYATAETAICNLADTVLTARGQRSRYLGPDKRYVDHVTLDATNLQTDTLFTDIRNRRVVEKLLADPKRGPGAQTRALVKGYAAGVNAYLRDIGGARNITDPACRGAAWVRPNATAKDIWYAVYAANLLASTGVFVPQIADAAPPSDLEGSSGAAAGFATPPSELPDRRTLLTRLGKDPDHPFGSNATAVGRDVTTTGRGMVLGNPHFPWRGRYRFSQFHLTIPGKYDVAGAGLIGSPVVNIGWNQDVAWSHTVSTAYRFTPYEYRTIPGTTRYVTSSGEVKQPVRRTVEIQVRRPGGRVETVTEDLWRTDEGYVLDAADVLMPWLPTSFWALRDANSEHLRTVDTFHLMAKARNVRDLLRKQDQGAGMPWVNTTAADRSGEVLYADHSVVPNVPDAMAQVCKTPVGNVLDEVAGLPGLDGNRADGDCAWGTDADASRPGVFGPRNLPKTFRKDWVINANDSYWLPNPDQRLEGFARIIGCEQCERSLRQRMVYRYVMDRLAGSDKLARGRKVSHRTLKLFEHENRVFGAELARENGDLVTVCEAAGGGESCDVLATWDGRSDIDSVGTHLFQEFWKRAQEVSTPLWQVPFDAADPVGTPRDLNESNPEVVQAMSDALAFLEERGIAPATPWGRLQVAGDDGAPPIPIGGGEGFAGNANAVASRIPAANTDRLYPLSYGSSHIQAIAFQDGGGVAAHTILTYGQSMDPTRATAADQTRLFSQERWVRFPWSDAQIRRDTVRGYVVRGR
ncbi:MAG TPA: penicillin acylase family protein [Nocardioides sp.]|nr:penicillin acylase family protein [Nocardioides sp.]